MSTSLEPFTGKPSFRSTVTPTGAYAFKGSRLVRVKGINALLTGWTYKIAAHAADPYLRSRKPE